MKRKPLPKYSWVEKSPLSLKIGHDVGFENQFASRDLYKQAKEVQIRINKAQKSHALYYNYETLCALRALLRGLSDDMHVGNLFLINPFMEINCNLPQ